MTRRVPSPFFAAALLAALILFPAADGADGTLPPEGFSLEEAIAESAAALRAKIPAGARVFAGAFDAGGFGFFRTAVSAYVTDELAAALADGGIETARRAGLGYLYRALDYRFYDGPGGGGRALGKFLGAGWVVAGELADRDGAYRWRLEGISVETGLREVSVSLDLRRGALEELFGGQRDAVPPVRVAGAGTPWSAGGWLDRGLAACARDDYGRAVEDFGRAIKLDPALTAAWLLRGMALSAVPAGRTAGGGTPEAGGELRDRALADYDQAILLDPDFPNGYNSRGLAWYAKGDYDRAVADYDRAILLDPDYALAYYNRANARYNRGDYDSALADYDRAVAGYDRTLRFAPDFVSARRYSDVYNNRGVAYQAKGDYDRAIADHDRAVRLNPDSAANHYNRGRAYHGKKDYDRAVADYSQAIRLNPDYVTAYHNRGLAYHGKKDYDRAIADYGRAIGLNPDYAPAYAARGRVHDRQGRTALAVQDLERAILLDPDFQAAKDLLGEIRARRPD
jgi:tetratricopeptide (TPR) repeat protein